MFSHVTVGSRDLDRAGAFYDAVLQPLGLVRRPVAPDGGPASLCWIVPGAALPRFYVYVPFDGKAARAGNGSMVAFQAPTPAAVDAAYAAGIAAQGADCGKPGPRPHYGADYYGAYLRDPDGNKVHVVCRGDVQHRGATDSLKMQVRYKAWANGLTFNAVMQLPDGEALRPRPTRFGNMVHTLNHVYVIDDIFKHHLLGRPHGYTSRNTEHTPAVMDLWNAVQDMDRWYIALVDGWRGEDLAKPVHFTFVGGGEGVMTQEEIVLHVVNHGTYHRGFVGDMMYQVPAMPPSNDLPVFIRDHPRKGM